MRQHKRCILKKKELQEVCHRVSILHPTGADVPPPTIDKLPLPLANFMEMHPNAAYKVEWYYQGAIFCDKGEWYEEKFNFNKMCQKDILTKFLDTMGFSDWQMSYKMWVESLRTNGQIIKYEGMGYQQDVRQTNFQIAKMMSMVIDYNHVITVTLIL